MGLDPTFERWLSDEGVTFERTAIEFVRRRRHPNARAFHNDDDDDTTNNEYLSCDPFSKLKFDDLRKVHKDQTIFNVSENDLKNVKQYNNVEQFQQARNSQSLNPMEERKAQQQFQQQEKLRREHMMQKQHKSQLQTMEYENKNKSVMASMFLQLKNG